MIPIIHDDDIRELAPNVVPKAQKMRGIKSPFISFESLESLCQGNETLEICLLEVRTYSLRYAETVCRFEQILAKGQISNENGERKEIETIRGSIHEATIASINSLARAMKVCGKDNSWIKLVSLSGRASYGKFAVLVAFEVVLRKEVYRG